MKKKKPPTVSVDCEPSDDPTQLEQQIIKWFQGLSFGGNHYNSYVYHVDGVFKLVVEACYGKIRFIDWTNCVAKNGCPSFEDVQVTFQEQ
jgi:hypothetical protein